MEITKKGNETLHSLYFYWNIYRDRVFITENVKDSNNNTGGIKGVPTLYTRLILLYNIFCVYVHNKLNKVNNPYSSISHVQSWLMPTSPRLWTHISSYYRISKLTPMTRSIYRYSYNTLIVRNKWLNEYCKSLFGIFRSFGNKSLVRLWPRHLFFFFFFFLTTERVCRCFHRYQLRIRFKQWKTLMKWLSYIYQIFVLEKGLRNNRSNN